MKHFVLLLAASATLLVPAAPAFAASTGPNAVDGVMPAPAATAQLDGVSRIPPELCFAFFGSDLENVLCSTH
jgi:hypothetical protein